MIGCGTSWPGIFFPKEMKGPQSTQELAPCQANSVQSLHCNHVQSGVSRKAPSVFSRPSSFLRMGNFVVLCFLNDIIATSSRLHNHREIPKATLRTSPKLGRPATGIAF